MRHADARFKLNRFTSWHKATLKSLARNMVIHQRIETTVSRAKAVRPLVEKLVSLAKKNTLNAKREAFKVLGCHKLVSSWFNEAGLLFAKRESGFTRIINLKKRRGDNAQLVIFELTERKIKERKKAKKTKGPASEEKIEKIHEGEKTSQFQEKKDAFKKPARKFLGGIKNIFKKERDSL